MSRLVPFIAAAQELKTKPTQHSVKELLSVEFSRTFAVPDGPLFVERHQVEDCAVLQRRGGR